jgi:hypothetical protein
LHSHCGKSGSYLLTVLGIWYPDDFAAVFVGLKLAITVAIQLGTLVELPQEGAGGLTGLAKLGLTPKVLFGPYAKPVLPVMRVLFPAAL